MVARRRFLGGGVLGGVLGVLAADSAGPADAAAAQRQSEKQSENMTEVTDAIDKLRQELRNERLFTELTAVREAQMRFLAGNGKFPDFIEVGTDVWWALHDWHIRWQQPITLGRDAIGRYTILLMQTIVIMRPETKDSIGLPYDNK
jgi:hypothetical protein